MDLYLIIAASTYFFPLLHNNNIYTFTKDILNNEFRVVIEIKKDKVTSKLIEVELDDEYLNVDINDIVGEYVGKIREEYEKEINNFLDKCTTKEVFNSKQTKEIIKYIKEKYNDDLEFLWEKFDNDAIWRNKKNNKWYGAILTVKESKISGGSDQLIEVLDLRYQKEDINSIVDKVKIFPGYHMNKNSWITIKLDNSIKNEKIFKLIDNSYNLIANPSKWIIPSNPNMFDVISYLNNNDTVPWNQSNNINIGDIIYIYVGAPYSSIMFKCIVTNVGIDVNWGNKKKAMTVDVIERYPKDKYPYSLLKKCGVGFIRGPRTITKELNKELGD